MATISDLMTDLNHDCDNHFTEAELAVGRGEWGAASGYFALFRSTMEQHFEVEETILFPAFEEEGGTEMGQTHTFSKEHLRMRELTRHLAAALERHDSVEYMNHSEALFALLLQHSAKAEQTLYPLMDDILSDRREALVQEITELTEGN
jgi:hemerythrin-like domain-containing protein